MEGVLINTWGYIAKDEIQQVQLFESNDALKAFSAKSGKQFEKYADSITQSGSILNGEKSTIVETNYPNASFKSNEVVDMYA
jgi:hypothetical protein